MQINLHLTTYTEILRKLYIYIVFTIIYFHKKYYI